MKKINSGYVIEFIVAFFITVVLFCSGRVLYNNAHKTDYVEPTIADYERHAADIDTVIIIHDGIADTASILVWNK